MNITDHNLNERVDLSLVYIVDDEQILLRSLKRLVSRNGLNVKTVKIFSNPLEAKLAIDNGDRPYLIISDYNMPEMDGIELTAHVSQVSPFTYCFIHSGAIGFSEERKFKGALREGNLHQYGQKPCNELLIELVKNPQKIYNQARELNN